VVHLQGLVMNCIMVHVSMKSWTIHIDTSIKSRNSIRIYSRWSFIKNFIAVRLYWTTLMEYWWKKLLN